VGGGQFSYNLEGGEILVGFHQKGHFSMKIPKKKSIFQNVTGEQTI